MAETVFPEWVKIGAPAIVVWSHFGSKGVSRGTVVRITKTRFTVQEEGRDYVRQFIQPRWEKDGDWVEYGCRSDAYVRVMDAASERAKILIASGNRRRLRDETISQANRFINHPDADTARSAIAALNTFIRSENNVT